MAKKYRTGLTADHVRERLDYNTDTGILTWKYWAPAGPRWNGKWPGKSAGTKHPCGRIAIKIGGGVYLAHRLIWLYVHGEWPPQDIDHRMRDGGNNRLINLRAATHQQNMRNCKKHKNNTTGLKGVFLYKNRFRAQIGVDKKSVHLGIFETVQAAHAAYCAAAVHYFGEFARFE